MFKQYSSINTFNFYFLHGKITFNIYEKDGYRKYKFICLKYFKKLTPIKIQERMNLTEDEQEDLKIEILNSMLAVAIKKNMLKEVEV